MKILTQSDVATIKFRARKSPAECVKQLRLLLANLEVNGNVLVERSEWTLKNGPTKTIFSQDVSKGFMVRELEDKSGWVLTRTA